VRRARRKSGELLTTLWIPSFDTLTLNPLLSPPAPLNAYQVKELLCVKNRFFHYGTTYFKMANLFNWGDL
jgi:hypothetical protein